MAHHMMRHRWTRHGALGLAALGLLAGCGLPGGGTAGPTTPAGSSGATVTSGTTAPSGGASSSTASSGEAPSSAAPSSSTASSSDMPSTRTAPDPAVRTVTTGLEAPWSIAFLDDGTALVSQRDDGTVLELTAAGGGTFGTRTVGTVDGVVHGGEGGLLGLAVVHSVTPVDGSGDAPAGAAEDRPWLFAYSTGPQGNRIQRFPLTGSPGNLGLGPAETVLDGLPSAGNHNGGRMAFGPDGMLYATVGDAADPASAQDLDAHSGKILRLTTDGGIPGDNPFPGSPVYSYGHRNPQGLAWASDGTLFATEFGQDTWDELNVIEPGGNYGWPEVEGTAGGEDGPGDDAFIDPVQQWSPTEASPSGMAALGGTLYVANLRGQVLRAVPVDRPGSSTPLGAGEYGRLRDAVAAPDGSVWVLTNNTDGRGRPTEGDDRILAFTPDGSG